MKKILCFATAVAVLTSCGIKEEFQPVFTGKYPSPQQYTYYTDADFGKIISIKELAAMYEIGSPVKLGTTGECVIKGVITTTDQPGNFYKSFYIQDETGGIEIKVGKNGLYNDYKLGQTVYVDCEDLVLGMYGYKAGSYGGIGMVQLGYSDPSGSYETSYLEIPLLIDAHILRGNPQELTPLTPKEITSSSQLPNTKTDTQATNPLIGSYVTLKGLTYGNEVFCLLYLDSNKDTKAASNRVFLSSSNSSDATCGITTWAMSKEKMTKYLYSGVWDECKVGSGAEYATDANGNTLTLGSFRTEDEDGNVTYPGVEKNAYSISQYFKMGSTDIQIRTSGYCKFCDTEIDPDVLAGRATIDVTGILTIYQGSIQFVVNNIDDIVVNK